ncbi:MAG: rod shape-determining protein MreC [Bacteriovorax sp. MedPE-SWde]|nr:MAG: rod shape-determining protein MreC [Bacteriovorax sp. MedPE-SWde]
MKVALNEGSRLKIIINVLVISMALYGVSKRDVNVKETTIFENFMLDTLAPLQRGVTFVHHQVISFFDHYVTNVNASKENIALKSSVGDLKQHIFSLEQVEAENKRLKKLLQFGEDLQRKKILAQVVAWDSSSDFRVLRINKGHSDGIKLQSTVVTANGVVGYIYRLTDNFADILTILDPNNRVDVLINRTRSNGILEGYSGWRCMMKYVTRTDPVRLNDLVITSGLGNIYPKGLKVGNVSKVERESYGITQNIEVAPTVDFSKLEEVVVLVAEGNQRKKLEWQALDGGQAK